MKKTISPSARIYILIAALTLVFAILLSVIIAVGIHMSSDRLKDGAVYVIKYRNTEQCLNVAFRPGKGDANLVIDPWNEETNEQWLCHYDRNSDAYYFTPLYRPDGYLHCPHGVDTEAGAAAKLVNSRVGDTASQWRVSRSGRYARLVNVASGLALNLDCGNTSTGTKVILQKDQADSEQQCWTFRRVSGETKRNGTDKVVDGGVYAIKFKDTELCANVWDARGKGDVDLILNEYNGENNEKWIARYNSTYDAFYFTALYRPESSLTCPQEVQSGNHTFLHESESGIEDPNSLWRVTYVNGYARLVNVASGYALSANPEAGYSWQVDPVRAQNNDISNNNQSWTIVWVDNAMAKSSVVNNAKMQEFMDDPEWSVGTLFGKDTACKASPARLKFGSGFAYVMDYVKVVHDKDFLEFDRKYTSVSEIHAGDILQMGNLFKNHWVIVLSRNEDNLEILHGDWTNGLVCRTSAKISGSSICLNPDGNSDMRSFVQGYHYF